MRAGVVGSDVGAFGTAAFRPRALVPVRRLAGAKQSLDESPIDAVGLLNPLAEQVIAAAGVHRDAVLRSHLRKPVGQVDPHLLARLGHLNALGSLQILEVPPDFAVERNEAEIAPLDESFQFARQRLERAEIERLVADARQDDRIEPPVDVRGRVAFGQMLQGAQGRMLVYVALEDRRQRRQSVVEVGSVTEAIEDFEGRDERREVFRPEDETVHIVGSQRHVISPAAEGIDHAGESLLNPSHEPLAVEGRNVGAS